MSKKLKKETSEIRRDHFKLDLKRGLTSAQVDQRKEEGLINKTKKQVSKSYLRIIYDNVVNFFNILLFAVAIFMIIAKIDIWNFSFLGILIVNIGIGLYQDIRARRLLDKLKVVSSVKASVLRDGQIQQVEANDLVFSDVVVLKQGNQLVCDGEIVEGSLEMNESLLTGESKTISKTVGDQIYSGSFVIAGSAKYRINRIGKENYAETLQQNAKKFKRVKSDILAAIKLIFKVVGFVIVVLASVEIGLKWKDLKSFAGPAFSSAVGSISGSIIAMVPIGMYLLTSLTLAVGVIRLVRKRMLTQDMYCIESLARVNTLCLDKTGTITDGKLKVLKVISTSKTSEEEIKEILKTLMEATKDENATSRAIKEEFSKVNVLDYHSGVPFSSERKFSAVMLKDGRSIVFGAREFIPHKDEKVDEACQAFEKDGMRVLIIAKYKKVVNVDEALGNGDVLGFVVLQDHIKEDAPSTIKWFKENGVDIRIITGDNPESAAEIARRAGVEGADKFVSLEGMNEEQVRKAAIKYVIFGRVTPEQKQFIIEALKEEGRTVAMTGDGVNDILALRVADCSIAMASGSDAAKNVAHLVSTDSSFASLPDVVREGRRVINNLQRSVSLFLIKTAFAIVITTLFIVGAFNLAHEYPFVAKNMMLWEFISIGIGSLFLSLQPNDEQIKSKFMINIIFRIIPAALVQIGLVMFFFLYCKNYELAHSLSVLAISIFSFIILIRVCLPFDIYRAVLVGALALIGVILLVADFFVKSTAAFGVDYTILDTKAWLTLLLVILVAGVVYFGLSIGASKLHKYIDKKREEKLHENF